MITTTLPRGTPPKAAPARPSHLFLQIGGTFYVVRPLGGDPTVATRSYRLGKADGTSYDLAATADGPRCDCPDFLYRRDGLDPRGCKHIRALVDLGMLLPQPMSPAGRGLTG